ncbi:MAG: tetratricopeptide repeat protein, partial [Acidobacteria bacterium]|nr:tetratricopeptide repeat protein [Acidobacteriota bacterium]
VEPTGAQSLAEGDPNEAATAMLRPLSSPGVVMGTVGYMSPEQAQGKTDEIDHRSDIFSFGCLLYEAATGRRPFEGDSLIKSLHKLVYESAPPIAEFNPVAPAELQRIVRRCLAKDREERYQSIKDVAIELRELSRGLDEGAGLQRTDAPDASRRTNTGDKTLLLTADERAAQTNTAGATTAASVGSRGSTGSVAAQSFVVARSLGGSGIAAAPRGRRLMFVAAALAALVAVAGFGAYLYRSRGAGAIDSIAVLPLANATNDASADWLADGITESVIYKLSQVPDLKVIARSSVFRYKGREVDPAQAAKELGVRAILAGRFVEHGDDLTVSVELVDAREGKVLWGERYERKVADANVVQQEIVRAVSDHLRPKMSGGERAQVEKTGTANPEAYQLYLKGRFYWNKRTEEDLKKGIDFFQQATALDPDYALAYAGLADAYEVLPSYSNLPPEETYFKSEAAARKAIELDPTLAEPHAALGGTLSEYEWKFAEAESEFKRAVELNPNNATAHQWYGEFLSVIGRHDEAIAEAQRAQQLDPQSPIINSTLAGMYTEARRYDEAVAQFRHTLEIDPNFAQAHDQFGTAYEDQGKYEEATGEYRKAALLFGEPPDIVEKRAASAVTAYRTGGARAYWQSELEWSRKEAQAHGSEPTPAFLAGAYSQLGDKDRAFAELEKAYQRRSRFLIFLKVEPLLDPLRSDPRFADLARRVGLPQ